MTDPTMARAKFEQHGARAQALLAEVGRVVQGQRALLEHLLIGALCEGHVLLEGVPGLGKTLAARSFAAAIGGRFAPSNSPPTFCPATSRNWRWK